jgi:general secretion pathway protein H
VRKQDGFTLIELLVCLAILTLIAALAVPRLGRAGDHAAFRTAARDLAAALREARNDAIATGSGASFSIDLATGAFRVGAGRTRVLPPGLSLALVTTADDRLGEHGGAIRFFADGSSTGGSLSLARDGRRLDILVDWLTGRVTVAPEAALSGG